MENIEKTQDVQYEEMTDKPVSRLLLKLSVPAIISMMITNLYNIADTAFVGLLGTSESGATGVVFSFMSILQAVAFMCGQGSGSILARRLGTKNLKEATESASTGFFLSFSLGLLISILTFIFMDPILWILGSTKTIYPYAKTYIIYIALAAPFFTSSLTLNNILRYEGKAKLGTVGMTVGAVLNVGLDALFIFIFKMGIAGAALATAISQVVSFCILLSMFIWGKTQTKISFKHIAKSRFVHFSILATGFPSCLRQALTSISSMLLNQCAKVYGDAAVSAFSCVSKISFFSMAIAIGIGQGFQPICSFNYGAKRHERVKKAFIGSIVAEETVLFVLSIPMFIFAPQLIMLMRNDPAVIEIGVRALRLTCISSLFLPFGMMTEMGFQSIGSKFLATLCSSLRSGVVLIPTLLILASTRGLAGVQEAQPLAVVIASAIALIFYKKFLNKLSAEKLPE